MLQEQGREVYMFTYTQIEEGSPAKAALIGERAAP